MSYKLKGKFITSMPVKVVSDKFSCRDFVVETEGDYPQKVTFQLSNGNNSKVDGLSPGAEIEVAFDIRGREYNGKYYNTLNAYKIEITDPFSF